MEKKDNVNALFLGPKSENEEFFKETLNMMMNEHMEWRKEFHPHDSDSIRPEEKREEVFRQTQQRTMDALKELSEKLKKDSMPWFSPRYLGQMNSDTLMAANLGYMSTILYNPNNCAYEGSPATTELEIEAGKDLAKMLGYDEKKGWGHITCGGTIANYEGFWMARNTKSIPYAISKVMPELVKGKSEWELMNMNVDDTLDLVDEVRKAGKFEEMRDYSVRGMGTQSGKFGKILVPQSKHYSWPKAADVLGIGKNNLINVQVDENFRTDLNHLRETIDSLVEKKIPIMGVVTVMGSTEEGAVDDVAAIVALRKEYRQKGINFYLHIDAAYGGYARTIFLDEDNKFMDYDKMNAKLHKEGVILHKEINWPKKSVYDAYKVMGEADSTTIDPHKMGYVPYAAGAIVVRDRRILDMISYFANYVLEKGMKNSPTLLGSYIMEGSKAGASAAAVWTAHRAVPLNLNGYGRIIGKSLEGADRFYDALVELGEFKIKDKTYTITPLTNPDFNIVCFSVNEKGNTSLDAMNELNQKIFDKCSYKTGAIYKTDFITSKTELEFDNYGDAPKSFVENCKIPGSEWDKIKSVRVLRACILSPWLISNTDYKQYWGNFINTLKKVLEEIA